MIMICLGVIKNIVMTPSFVQHINLTLVKDCSGI